MLAVVIQRPDANSMLRAECLTSQPALFKLPHQSLSFRPAPPTSNSYTNQLAHPASSSHLQFLQKGAFGLARTVVRERLRRDAICSPRFGNRKRNKTPRIQEGKICLRN
jgi:hypothetical protein